MPKLVLAAVLFFLALFFAEFALGLVDLVTYIYLSGLGVYFTVLYLTWRVSELEKRLEGPGKRKR